MLYLLEYVGFRPNLTSKSIGNMRFALPYIL